MCLKLSNSEEILKLLVSSDNRKIVRGPINNRCKVISQMMTEKEIGYCGSKSITGLYNGYKSVIVKEQ